jgi:hypothetical protein
MPAASAAHDEAATPRNLREDLKVIGAQHVCQGPFSQSWK